VANAAPAIPYLGIKIMFKEILTTKANEIAAICTNEYPLSPAIKYPSVEPEFIANIPGIRNSMARYDFANSFPKNNIIRDFPKMTIPILKKNVKNIAILLILAAKIELYFSLAEAFGKRSSPAACGASNISSTVNTATE